MLYPRLRSVAPSGAINGRLSYRVKKAIGTDPDPVQVVSDVEGLTFTLLGLPTGATVEFSITLANDTGDGPPSPTVSALVP